MLQPLKDLALKFLSPQIILKFLKKKHLRTGDPELRFIKDLIPAGTDAVDVGVYRGVYTSVMADNAGLVYAFEPHPHNYAFSKKALPKEKVKLFTEALSNKNGEAQLQIQEVFDEIINMGYKGFYYFNGDIHPLSAFSWKELQPTEFIGIHTNYVNNFMFIHNSRNVPFNVVQ